MLAFTALAIILVSLISLMILKLLSRIKENKKIEKTRIIVHEIFYFCVMLISVIGILYFIKKGIIETKLFQCSTVLFIISFVLRIIRKKDEKIKNRLKIISSILCLITTAIVIYTYIEIRKVDDYIERYNEQFYGDNNSATEIINKVRDNNKGERKVTIRYKNQDYTTEEELQQLLDLTCNSSKKYKVVIYEYDEARYVKSIKLSNYANYKEIESFNSKFQKYEGNSITGTNVRALINSVKANNAAQMNGDQMNGENHFVRLKGLTNIQDIKPANKYTVKITDEGTSQMNENGEIIVSDIPDVYIDTIEIISNSNENTGIKENTKTKENTEPKEEYIEPITYENE